MEYEESKAIQAINNALTAAGRQAYPEDEILNVVDMIWDYYEENGLLDIDDDFEPDEDENMAAELADYIRRMLRKDKASKVADQDVDIIVQAELDYEDSTLNDL